MNKITWKKSKLLLAVILPILLLISLSAGCELPFSTEIIDEEENNEDTIPQVNEIPENEKKLTVELFFGDEEAIFEDVSGEYGYVTPVHRTISFKSEEIDILKTTIEELISGPQPEENGLSSTIPGSTKVIEVIIEDATAVVDLSQDVITDFAGGALGGALFKQSMVYTATQFPSVENLVVLVEGSPWNDGHSIWNIPLSRDNLSQY